MNMINTFFIVVGGILLIALFGSIFYNKFIALRNSVKESWSGIDIQLKKRADVVPNLVETVKGYASHESKVFENVTRARSAVMNAGNPEDAATANNMLTNALKSLFAVSEAYPELKASENFRSLQTELSQIEEKIAYSRQFYNANVRDYNNAIQVFPGLLFASIFGFKASEFFAADESDKQQVDVKF